MATRWEIERILDNAMQSLRAEKIEESKFNLERLKAEIGQYTQDLQTKEKQVEWFTERQKKEDTILKELLSSKRSQFIVSFIINVGMFVILAGLYLAEKLK